MRSEHKLMTKEPPEARIRVVAEVFQQVVGVGEVDADADFFAIGGHSLLVIEAIGRLRTHHGLGVPARQFFTDAGVRAVASACVPLDGPDGEAPSGAGEVEER